MKLIIINGPAGVGKSTISTKLQENISNSILIDIDELRRSIPNYREEKEQSLKLAYEKTNNLIEYYLQQDKSVIIDKYISSSEVLDSFIKIAKTYDARVYEILLWADKDTIQQRADDRGYRSGGLLNKEKVGELWEKLNLLKLERQDATVVDTGTFDVDQVSEKVLSIVN